MRGHSLVLFIGQVGPLQPSRSPPNCRTQCERCSLLLNLTEFIGKSRRVCVNCMEKEEGGEKQIERESERKKERIISFWQHSWIVFVHPKMEQRKTGAVCLLLTRKRKQRLWFHPNRKDKKDAIKWMGKAENKTANEKKPLMNHLCFVGWSLYSPCDMEGDGYGWLAFYFLTLYRPGKQHGADCEVTCGSCEGR